MFVQNLKYSMINAANSISESRNIGNSKLWSVSSANSVRSRKREFNQEA
jgi:hypothetical protein